MTNLAWRKFGRSHAIELITGVILGFVIVYLVVFIIRVNSGFSRSIDTPSYVVRLQVVNGTAGKARSCELIDELATYRDTDLEIRIVARDEPDMREVPRSMVISRVANLSAARLLANKLGLDPGGVFYRPLEHNRDHVSVTLLLGQDYEKLVLSALSHKETAN